MFYSILYKKKRFGIEKEKKNIFFPNKGKSLFKNEGVGNIPYILHSNPTFRKLSYKCYMTHKDM